ncbi:MAG: NAD(P)-dependent oxidoreductase [Candidatus Fermentibacter sp.]|nr:NAD(P)-dependent oxidoreductase [Candidatus Fermentibacter sp.]
MRYLVTGSRGLLGSLFMERLGPLATGVDLPETDLAASPAGNAALVAASGAGTVINCAALTDVDYCETHGEEAFRIHAAAVEGLARAAARLVTFSTDHVFSGPSDTPFIEGCPVSPANVYAESKLAGEMRALENPSAIVVRTSWLFAGGRGLVPRLLAGLESGDRVRAVVDQTACVTYAPDLVEAVLAMLEDGFRGLVHAVNRGPATPFSIAQEFAGTRAARLEPVRWSDLGLSARRPVYSALATATRYVLPSREEAVGRWRKERKG